MSLNYVELLTNDLESFENLKADMRVSFFGRITNYRNIGQLSDKLDQLALVISNRIDRHT